MASVNFNLRDVKARDKTAIFCILRYDNKKVRIITGLSVEPSQWNTAKQRINNKMNSVQGMEINAFLNYFQEDVLAEFYKFKNENNRNPELHEIKSIIELKHYGKQAPNTIPSDFFGYWDYYINNQRKSTSLKTGKLISENSLQGYLNSKAKFLEFEKERKKKITFNSIDLDFYFELIAFLENQGYSKNTVGKHIKVLKAVLNDATSNQINTNLKYTSNKFNVLKEESTEIYLNPHELELIRKLDLTKDHKLRIARDLFLLLCFTGQRYQSLVDIVNPENRDTTFIRLKQDKTSARVVIPILEEIKEPLRYLRPKDVMGNPQLNKLVKEMGAMIPELHVFVTHEITKGGKMQVVEQKKYELISTHTGRRSFATNFYTTGKIPIAQLMAITGHKKESTFFAYIRTSPDEHAQRFLDLVKP